MVLTTWQSVFRFFCLTTGISDAGPPRFLPQAGGSNITMLTRHHYQHFPTLSLEHPSLSLDCPPSPTLLHYVYPNLTLHNYLGAQWVVFIPGQEFAELSGLRTVSKRVGEVLAISGEEPEKGADQSEGRHHKVCRILGAIYSIKSVV
jgi:hypothetical protein